MRIELRRSLLLVVVLLAVFAQACTTCWCRRLAEHDEIGYEPSDSEPSETESARANDPPERHADREDRRSFTTTYTSVRAAEPAASSARFPDLRVSPASFAPTEPRSRTRDD